MNLSEITSCKEYSSNLPDDRKIVKLIVVNLIVIFFLKPIYIYIYIYIFILSHLRVVNLACSKQCFDGSTVVFFKVHFICRIFSLFTIYFIKVYTYCTLQFSLEASYMDHPRQAHNKGYIFVTKAGTRSVSSHTAVSHTAELI